MSTSSAVARSSIRRSPRWTCPSSAPSRVGRERGPRSSSRVRPTSWRRAAASEEVGAESRVDAGGLAAERCHVDRVLEQAARVAVVPCGRGGQAAKPLAQRRVREQAVDDGSQPRVVNLGGQELEEAVELVEVAAGGGHERGRRPRPRARAPAPRAGGGRGTARRARARGPRRPPRSAGRSARRRPTPGRRAGRSDRRARARGRGRPERVRRRSLRATAKTPSAVRSAASSAIGVAALTTGV